jgi:hypothetical protein
MMRPVALSIESRAAFAEKQIATNIAMMVTVSQSVAAGRGVSVTEMLRADDGQSEAEQRNNSARKSRASVWSAVCQDASSKCIQICSDALPST